MILVVDSSALVFLINPDAIPPIDPATGSLLEHGRQRIAQLVEGLTSNDTIVVPTPVLAELLIKAEEAGPDLFAALNALARIRIEPFDERAAIELAAMTREAIAGGDKRSGSDEPWQKVKFDRQIVAIARMLGANCLYADDKGLVKFARSVGLDVVSTWELPLPPSVEDLFTVAGIDPTAGALIT